MIFCFSGTGNSLHVAQTLATINEERIVMMTETERRGHKVYSLKTGEKIGFIFPIYWWGMPTLVEQFIKDLCLRNYCENYTYAIVTFGLGAHNGMVDLEKLLNKKQIVLKAKYEVQMVDNYVVGYEMINQEKQTQILAKAEEQIGHIIASIQKEETKDIKDLLGTTIKPMVHYIYQVTQHQKKFHVTDRCIGCGICKEQCPCNAIAIKEGKPQWEKNCTFCLKCLHLCPKQAIQYGKGTAQRKRYFYPNT